MENTYPTTYWTAWRLFKMLANWQIGKPLRGTGDLLVVALDLVAKVAVPHRNGRLVGRSPQPYCKVAAPQRNGRLSSGSQPRACCQVGSPQRSGSLVVCGHLLCQTLAAPHRNGKLALDYFTVLSSASFRCCMPSLASIRSHIWPAVVLRFTSCSCGRF